MLAAKLKQTMLLLNGNFNEANLGYPQFKNWLEANSDLLTLFVQDFQLHVAPSGYVDDEWETSCVGRRRSRQRPEHDHRRTSRGWARASAGAAADGLAVKPTLRQQYNQIFNRLKMTSVDFATRRDVLRDIYRELIRAARPTHDGRSPGGAVRPVRDAGADPQQDDAAPDLADGLPPARLRLWRPGGVGARPRLARRRDRQRGRLRAARRVGLRLRRGQRRAGYRSGRSYPPSCWTTTSTSSTSTACWRIWNAAAWSWMSTDATCCRGRARSRSPTSRRCSRSSTTSRISRCRTA